MTQPGQTLTLEAFKAKMLEKHEVTLRASMEVVKISNGILYEPVAEPLHKVMRAIARVVVNSNGAVMTTATYGYGNDAAKIVRSMFEGAVTIAWLRKKPKLVFDYIDDHKVTLWQQYQIAAAKDPDLVKRLGKERVAEMRMDHDIARPRFLNKKKDLIGSWCRLSIRQRAEDVGLGEFYPAFYARASDMTFRALADFNEEAKLKYDEALEAVHKFYIQTLLVRRARGARPTALANRAGVVPTMRTKYRVSAL